MAMYLYVMASVCSLVNVKLILLYLLILANVNILDLSHK